MSEATETSVWKSSEGEQSEDDEPLATLKQCTKCSVFYALESFSTDNRTKDGKFVWCKSCQSSQQKTYRDEKKRLQEETNDQNDRLAPNSDAMYVIINPRIPGEVKIGRSRDPESRAKCMSMSQNFRLSVIHSYPEKGFLEKTVHSRLSALCVEDVPGQEWFRLSHEQADAIVRAVVVEHELGILRAISG